MLNPYDLQILIVEKLRAIPELVMFVGDVGEIQAYDDESETAGNTDIASNSQIFRGLMVFWTGAELPRDGGNRGWKHSFKVALKAESIMGYYRMAQFIFDGIPAEPAGDGFQTFLTTDIPLTDGIQDLVVEPERSEEGVGRVGITFTLTER